MAKAKKAAYKKAAKKPKLTIELVPQTCWYSNVRSQVSREVWDRLRRMIYLENKHCCFVCGGKGPRHPVECHEEWEYDDEHHTQTLKRLIALCPACHEVKHIGLAGVRGNLARAMKHLARVNAWKMPEARAYVDSAFAQWEARSAYEWDLDIDYLDQFDSPGTPEIRRSHREKR